MGQDSPEVPLRMLFSGCSFSANRPPDAGWAELDWLLCNKPLEYDQLVLGGEIEHYLSLGCDHGRLEDQRHNKHSPALAKEKPKRGCIQ